MSRRLKNLLFGFLIAALLVAIFALTYYLVRDERIRELNAALGVLGGKWPFCIIQGLAYTLFFFALLEVRSLSQQIKREYKGFGLQLLPESEQYVLSPQDVNNIKLAAIQQENIEKYFVVDVIKKACTKYRSNKSTDEVIGVIESLLRTNVKRSESERKIISYAISSITLIGCIGFVVGVGLALGYSAEAPGNTGFFHKNLMYSLYPLSHSLLLNLILEYFYHNLKEQGDNFYADAEGYVLENLVNRLHPE